MADSTNILRVGAEFDISALIAGTEQAVASLDEVQAALQVAADTATAAGEKWQVNAANLMSAGIAAQDVAQNLVRFGATQQQADAAVKAVNASVIAQIPALAQQAAATSVSTTATGAAATTTTASTTATAANTAAQAASVGPTTAKATATTAANVATAQQTTTTSTASAQIAAMQQQINQLNAALANLQAQLANTTTRTGGFGGAMGAARVEAGALTGSTGMMVGGLARVAAQSQLLAPIIQAAFPVFAIVAFIAILDAGIKKLEEWANAAIKSADAQAEFDRAVAKSAESLEAARAHLAGLGSANAELAEKMRTSSLQVVDLSENAKKLNERIGDGYGYFRRLKDGLGIAYVATGEFIGLIDQSERDLQTFNSRTAETVKHSGDLSRAITDVSNKLKELHAEEAAAEAGGAGVREINELKRRIDEETKFYNTLIDDQGKALFAERSLQIESDQRLLEDHAKALRARAALETSEATALLRAHAITYEQERELRLSAAAEAARAEQSIISSRIAMLRQEASEGLISRAAENAGIRELNAQREALEIEARRTQEEIINSTDQNILRQTIETGDARIAAAHTVSEELAKLEEDRAKRAFKDAETIGEMNATAPRLIAAETAAYEDQIKKLQQRAALLESTLTIKKPSGAFGQAVTADLGTDEFTKQIEQIRTLDSAKYAELVRFDAEVRKLKLVEVDAEEKTEQTKADRIKKIEAEQVDTNIKSISENLSREEALYHEDIAHLQELHDQKKLTLREYTQAAIMFTNEEFQARAATLKQETDFLKAARDADFITEESYEKKVEAIHAQLAKFQEDKEKQVTDLTKQEIQKREQAYSAAAKKIADEFVAGIDKMIQGNQSLGRSAAQMAGQIELNLINKGIERVVTKYGEDFVKLLASHTQFITQFISDHSTFLATLLGIETTSDAKKLAQTIASNTTQISSDAGLSFAAAFSSVMEALPFPENIATAPEVAATAAAQTEAGALIFERGGIVPATLHAGEMVLPEKISTAIQGAIPAISNFNRASTNNQFVGGSVGATTKTMHNHINLNIVNKGGSGFDHDAIIASVKEGIRRGALNFD